MNNKNFNKMPQRCLRYLVKHQAMRRNAMKKVDMIVKAPHFFTMEGEGVGYVGDAVMLIDGGKILEILPQKRQ